MLNDRRHYPLTYADIILAFVGLLTAALLLRLLGWL